MAFLKDQRSKRAMHIGEVDIETTRRNELIEQKRLERSMRDRGSNEPGPSWLTPGPSSPTAGPSSPTPGPSTMMRQQVSSSSPSSSSGTMSDGA